MNKIGLMTVWGADFFVEPAILQGLDLYDELLVMVGCHHDSMLKYEDNTYDICKKYSNCITIVDSPKLENMPYTYWRAEVLNHLLAKSKLYDIGSYACLADVDEFLMKEDIQSLKELLDNGEYDEVAFEERYFYINMHHYLCKTTSPRIRLIKSWYDHFIPTDNWCSDRNINKSHIIKRKNGVYHYSLLCNPHAKKTFWTTERSGKQRNKCLWLEKIYLNYDLNEEDFWNNKNKELFDVESPIFVKELGTDNGKLFRHNTPHPEVIQKTELCDIKDFREIY